MKTEKEMQQVAQEAQLLKEEELDKVSGGKKPEGNVCPNCGMSLYLMDPKLHEKHCRKKK